MTMRERHELEFEPEGHVYKLDGSIVPSVTQVLAPYEGLDQVDATLLEITRDFGSHVHLACHLYNAGELDEDFVDEKVGAYLEGWIRFCEERKFAPLQSEVRLYHAKLKYAGTLDTIGRFLEFKQDALLDIKTGATVPRTVGAQTAAYAQALGRRLPRFCCLLTPGAYQLVPLRDIRDYDVFNAALLLHRTFPPQRR